MDRLGSMVCTAAALGCVRRSQRERMRRQRRSAAAPRARRRSGSTSAWSASAHGSATTTCSAPASSSTASAGSCSPRRTPSGARARSSSRPASACCTAGSSPAPPATTSRCSRSIRASPAWPRCRPRPPGRRRQPAAALARPPPGGRHGRSRRVASIPVRATAPRLRRVGRLPLPAAGIPLDSPLVPEVSGGPVVDQAGRLVGMAAGDGRPARRRPGRHRAVGRRSASGSSSCSPGRASVYVGWADQYRCVGRQHAYARETHPGLPAARRAAQRAGRADAAARHGRDGRLMSVLAADPGRSQRAPALGDRRCRRCGMVVLLLAPAAAVLLTREPRDRSDGTAPARRPAAHRRRRRGLDRVGRQRPRQPRRGARRRATSSRRPRSHAAGSSPLRLAVGQGSVWTANAGDDTVTRFDPLVPGSGRRIRLGAEAVDVAVSPEGAWVTQRARPGTVTRIDPIANRVLGEPVRTGSFPAALTVGAGFVWVVNAGDGTVARIDPREDVVIGRRLPVGRDPQDIAVGHGSVWVANRGDGTVTRLSAADRPARRARRSASAARPARSRSRATASSCSTRCAATCGRSLPRTGRVHHLAQSAASRRRWRSAPGAPGSSTRAAGP